MSQQQAFRGAKLAPNPSEKAKILDQNNSNKEIGVGVIGKALDPKITDRSHRPGPQTNRTQTK